MELIVVGEPAELDVEDGLVDLPPDHHMLHVVVKDFFGRAAQIIEGVNVAVHEGLEGRPFHELDIHGAGVSQDHDEGEDRMGRPVGFRDLEVTPVDLRLEVTL